MKKWLIQENDKTRYLKQDEENLVGEKASLILGFKDGHEFRPISTYNELVNGNYYQI